MSYETSRKRTESFMRHTNEDFDRGDYDLVLFHIEQALQLYTKYLLDSRLKDLTKTYSIVRSLQESFWRCLDDSRRL